MIVMSRPTFVFIETLIICTVFMAFTSIIFFGFTSFIILVSCVFLVFFFFFQAEDGIRDLIVTGVQTCALPILGVETGGAVKNVLAVGAGLSDGLGFGANTRVALITRGLVEMMRLGVALGAQRETFMGLAGLGDLVLTCTDDQSRNRRLGLLVAAGRGARAAP